MLLGFAESHHKIMLTDKSRRGYVLEKHYNIGQLLFNISATAEASDFKIGMHLGFAKAHHKVTPRRKRVGVRGLGDLPKIFEFFDISATAEASDFKFGMQLGFAKAHHKITPRKKWA